MAKLVFDIETSALPHETFDEAQQEYLFRDAEKLTDEAAREARRAEIQQLFNLWPLTARVVCVAMLNAETLRGKVLFTAEDFEADTAETGPVEFVPCMDEAELLTAFWELARHYDGIVTFNTLTGTFSSALFAVNTAEFQNPFGGMFSVVRDGNALDLFYTPVPEPSVTALLAAGLVALRRRRSVLE